MMDDRVTDFDAAIGSSADTNPKRQRGSAVVRPRLRFGLVCAAIITITAVPVRGDDAPPEKPKYAIHLAKIVTSAGPAIDNGTILVSNGKIEALGPRDKIKVPDGYTVIDHGDKFAMPGCVDAHCHVGGNMGDINEMVYPTNPNLRILDTINPHNESLKRAVAGGVTTVCYIPGSGTNMGGFGALMKTGPGTLDEVLIRFPGVLKIAQAGNPERQTGEFGSGRMGMNWNIREQLRAGRDYNQKWLDFEEGRSKEKPAVDLRYEYFKPLFRQKIPVVVHTQGYQVIMSTLRILHDEMKLKVVIDHGEFDSFMLSDEIIKRDIPVMAGPRGFYYDRDRKQLVGLSPEFYARGVRALGVNTDSPVVPEEELFFQAVMAVRLGLPEDAAIRGLTIEPAKALMVADRVGSLEVGKDADIVIKNGPVLDPRSAVVQVLIDGKSVYDIKTERRRF